MHKALMIFGGVVAVAWLLMEIPSGLPAVIGTLAIIAGLGLMAMGDGGRGVGGRGRGGA